VSAQPGDQENRTLKAVASLIGVVGATAGLIYATGGLVLGLRLFVHHFEYGPVVGQLPRQFLLSFGLSEVVLPALAVAGLYAVWRLLRGYAKTPRVWSRRWAEQSWRWERAVSVGLALILAVTLVAPAAYLTARKPDWRFWVPLVVGFAVAIVFSIVLLELRALLGHDIGAKRRSRLAATVLMTVIVGVWSMPGFILLWADIALPSALLCPVTGRPYTGVLIGETSDRTYVGEEPLPEKSANTTNSAPSEGELHHRIISMPIGQVHKLFFGHKAATLTCSGVP
jgi:hypothetical protein